jgi:hypothetical protein
VVSILERWSTPEPVRRITVVTLPPSDAPREELWHRFCRAARMPAEDVPLGGLRDNVSLGYASCDVLRLLNVHLEDVRPRFYRQGMRALARDVLAPLRDAEARPELDRQGAELARRRNQDIRDAVSREGYELVGSLDDLPVPDRIAAPERVLPPPSDQVIRAAEAVRGYAADLLGPRSARSRDDREIGAESEAGSRAGGPTASLDEVVAEGARLLREAHGWGL